MKIKKVLVLPLLLLVACNNSNENSSVISSEKESNSIVSSLNNIESSYNSEQHSFNSSSNSETYSSNEVYSSNNDSPIELTYSSKIERYLDGVKINDTKFIDKLKSLEPYENNEAISSNAIYASSDGQGNGSINLPYSLQDGLDEVKPGQTLYLRGGKYNASSFEGFFINCKGQENNYIRIRNYPGEKVCITNPFNSKEAYGFQFSENCSYVIIEGIEIANITSYSAYGIVFWGNNQNHIIIRNMDIHDIKTSSSNPEKESDSGANAILLFGENKNPISNVVLMNNKAYNNINGWSENISITANCEYVYVLENEVSNSTNIGIDFYGNAEGYCQVASLNQPRYCVAAGNKITKCVCNYADNAGLYVDGARDIILQNNIISASPFGIEVGSEEKQEQYPVKNILVRNNIVHDNLMLGIRVGGYETTSTGIVYDTKFINNTLYDNNKYNNDSVSEITIAKVDNISFINNNIYSSREESLVKTDFNNQYVKNVLFDNNNFYVENISSNNVRFELFLSEIISIESFNEKVNGKNFYLNPKILDDYSLDKDSPLIDKGKNDLEYGNYDYYLNNRINNIVDIGAVECK